jgi:hypothetical protein
MHVLDGIAFYMHAGSGNHGCEAITVSLLRQLAKQDGIPLPVRLVTNSAAEDARYGLSSLDGIVALAQERRIAEHPPVHAAYYAWRRLTGDRESFLRYRLAPITGKDRPRLAVSVGGDNYCYPDMVPDLVLADHMLERQGTATMLLGCSIEPEVLKENTNMRMTCGSTAASSPGRAGHTRHCTKRVYRRKGLSCCGSRLYPAGGRRRAAMRTPCEGKRRRAPHWTQPEPHGGELRSFKGRGAERLQTARPAHPGGYGLYGSAHPARGVGAQQ